MVSRAFQILSDEDKKSRYDKFGGDPDSRFNPGPSASSGASPFSGFSGGGFPRSGGRPGFEEEISPEELFNRFFSGGFGGMGGGGFGMKSPECAELFGTMFQPFDTLFRDGLLSKAS